MAEIAHAVNRQALKLRSPWGELFRKEDWWAIWIGLGLIAVAVALFAGGSSIKWIAVAPQKWSHLSDVTQQLKAHGVQYAALFVLWAVAFGIGAAALGIKISRFLPAFLLVYLAAGSIYFLGQWDQAAHYNLEPPARGLGRRTAGLQYPRRAPLARPRVCGSSSTSRPVLCLLGAGLPLTLIAWAGPVAIASGGDRFAWRPSA